MNEMELTYFGEKWNSPMLEDAYEVPTPVGNLCPHCGEGFADGDQGWIYGGGMAVHAECGMRPMIGGVNHILGLCTCCGGTLDPDPPGMSRREAAKAALKLYEHRGQG